MASQSTLDKNSALRAQLKTAQETYNSLRNNTNRTADEQKQYIRARAEINRIEGEYRKDPNLIALAGENMSASDKLFTLGLGSGTVAPGGIGVPPAAIPLVTTAAAIQGAENIATGKNASAEPEATTKKPSAQQDVQIKTHPLPNVLHQYPSYTYGISLHLLTAEEYANILLTEKFKPNRVLVASAGRYNASTFPRNEFFNEDFYFKDLTFTTLIKPNDISRNTNAIEGSFTLIEPYGITFLNRLIDLSNSLKVKNYLDMPYLLQIDFFAHNDEGVMLGALPELTKHIPIKFLKMDVQASVQGSEYKIGFVPFHHSAYDTTTVTAQAPATVVAKTVEQFFQGMEQKATTTVEENNRQAKVWKTSDGRWVGADGQFTGVNTVGTLNLSDATKKELFGVKSFAQALNVWQADLLASNKIKSRDKYSFEFDPEIGAAAFTKTSLLAPKDTKMADRNDVSIKRADVGQSSDAYNTALREFTVNPGTSIEKVINFIVGKSDYIQNQLIFPEDYKTDKEFKEAKKLKEKEPFNWFKIVPIVKLIEFDQIRKIWSREITYYVKKYTMRNMRLDLAPQGVAEHPVKIYNYIYTGENNDVLDFDIKFEAMYFNTITAYKDAVKQIYDTAAQTEDTKSKNPTNYTGPDQDPNAVMPLVMKPVVAQTRSTTSSGAVTPRDIAVADLEESLMTMSQADMLTLHLKILGDPQFIKQDDIFYFPNKNKEDKKQAPDNDNRLTPNSSIKTDDGELYVQVMFRTPIDLDESTGKMLFAEKYKTSVFSGLYAVLKVQNIFDNGQFTQVLDLVRLPRQIKYDYGPGADKKASAERSSELKDYANPAAINTVTPKDTPAASAADPGDSQQTGQEQQPEAPEPSADKEQKDLMNDAKNMDTATMTASNEPQASVPTPNAGQISQLKSELADTNIAIGQYGGGMESSQSVTFNQNSADSFARSVTNQEARVQDAIATYGADAPIVADLQKDLQFYRRQQASFTAKAEEARAKLAEAQAKKSEIDARITTLQ